MKTENIYSLPLAKSNILSWKTDSPAHRKYHSTEHDADYDLTHAIDFLCHTGKPIKVALEGKVIAVVDGITKKWNKFEIPSKDFMKENEQDGNYVLIEHPNKEFSIYSHLQPKKIKVKVGDIIHAGKIIGYSGNNGWSIKPHLHFMVFRFLKPYPKRDFESLEINWGKNKK